MLSWKSYISSINRSKKAGIERTQQAIREVGLAGVEIVLQIIWFSINYQLHNQVEKLDIFEKGKSHVTHLIPHVAMSTSS